MYTIAIVNEKGGTGKTTTSVNLAAALGELGKQVLLVDLDGQAASSRWLGVEENTSFADALYLGKGLVPLPDVMPNVALAPGSGKLDAVAHDLRPTQGGQLRKLLMEAAGRYEFVVIDCPPSLGNRLIGNALLAATHAIVPVETSILALDGLKILLTTMDDVRDGFGHDIVLAGVVACRYDARTRLSRMVLTELKRALPGRVFQTVIRENVRMRECPASGTSILSYAPDSHAAEDYRSLARELIASPWLACQPSDMAGNGMLATDMTSRIGDALRTNVRQAKEVAAVVEELPGDWKARLENAHHRLESDDIPEIAAGADDIPQLDGVAPAEGFGEADLPPNPQIKPPAPDLPADSQTDDYALASDEPDQPPLPSTLDQPPPAADESTALPQADGQEASPPQTVADVGSPQAQPKVAAATDALDDWLEKVAGARPLDAAPPQPQPEMHAEPQPPYLGMDPLNQPPRHPSEPPPLPGDGKSALESPTQPDAIQPSDPAASAPSILDDQAPAQVDSPSAAKQPEPALAGDAWDLDGQEDAASAVAPDCPNLRKYLEKIQTSHPETKAVPQPPRRGLLRRLLAGRSS